jgi:hypothetical protein
MSLYSRAETQAQSIKVLNTTEKASVAKYESDGTLVAHDGNTNATAGAEGNATIQSRVVFIDDVEATLAENKERGLTSPGWWQYTSYTDASGETRHKCQHLAAFKDAPANVADTDDTVAADVASEITLDALQPVDIVGLADGAVATFDMTAHATFSSGTGIFQWQRQTATGTRWTNITDGAGVGGTYAGALTAQLTITGATKADIDGYKFRVKVTSTVGSEEKISRAATLGFA